MQQPLLHRPQSDAMLKIKSLSAPCRILAVLAGFILLAAPPAAQAGLGQLLSAASQDGVPMAGLQQRAFKSAPSVAPAAVQSATVQSPQGCLVTEYADGSGTVFAVTWRGAFKPDLRQLLGSYFGRYVSAARSAPASLTGATVQGNDIVVRSFGRMRNFSGEAWVPSLLPAGFNPAQLQP